MCCLVSFLLDVVSRLFRAFVVVRVCYLLRVICRWLFCGVLCVVVCVCWCCLSIGVVVWCLWFVVCRLVLVVDCCLFIVVWCLSLFVARV